MIMSIFGFEKKIIFNKNRVNVLEIYNRNLFSNIIEKLVNKSDGNNDDNEIVFNNGNQDTCANCYILTDLFNIDFNSKKILNKVYSVIINNIKNRQDNSIENIRLKIYECLIEEINELPFEFHMNNEIEISDLIKAVDLKIDTTAYISIIEKVEFIIDVLAQFKIADLLIIPNLKTYLNEKELVEIYKYSIYNNIRLLIIESHPYDKILNYEDKNIIDEEYGEY